MNQKDSDEMDAKVLTRSVDPKLEQHWAGQQLAQYRLDEAHLVGKYKMEKDLRRDSDREQTKKKLDEVREGIDYILEHYQDLPEDLRNPGAAQEEETVQ